MAGTDRNVSIIIAAKDAASGILGKVGIGVAGVAAAAFAAKKAFDVLSSALETVVNAASVQEDADVALAAALRTVGDNTEASRKRLDTFAGSLQDITTIDDQVIKGVAGILASLGRLSGEGLERATKATLDFAAATGQDAKAAANLVAKAADGYTSALTRYGIQVQEGLSDTDAFNQALEIMERKFGGLAAAMGKTFSAALRRISNDFGDFQEQLGNSIVKSGDFRTILDGVSKSIKDMQAFVKQNPELLAKMERGLLSATIVLGEFGLAVAENTVALGQNLDKIKFWGRVAHGVMNPSIIPASLFKLIKDGFSDVEEGADTSRDALGAFRQIIDQAKRSLQSIQDELARTAELELIIAEQGTRSAAGLMAMMDLLQLAKRTSANIPSLLGKGEADDVVDDVETIADAFESLGVSGIKKARDEAEQLRAKMAEALEASLLGDITREQFQLMSDQILEAAESLKQFGVVAFEELRGEEGGPFVTWPEDIRKFNENLEQSKAPLEDLGFRIQELDETITRELVGSALLFGDALVDAAFSAGRSWDEFITNLLAGIAKAIARMLILRAISAGLTGGASEAAGGFIGFQHGGKVSGGVPGTDSVAALLTPGEIVLPKSLAADFESIAELAREIRSGGGGTRPTLPEPSSQLFMRIEPRRDRLQEAIELVEDINDLAERRGMRVVATELVE